MQKKVSFIIPTRNSGKTIEMCLRSIYGQKYPKSKIEVIVVDGGSIDGTCEIAEKYGALVVKEKRNTVLPSPGSARNQGVNLSKGDYLFFLDGDCYIEPDYVNKLLDVLVRIEKCITGSNNIEPYDGNWVSVCWHLIYKWRSRLLQFRFIHSRALACSRKLFLDLNGFDPSLSAAEDVDLCQRAISAGFEIKEMNDVKVYHHDDHMAFLKGIIILSEWYGVGLAQFWMKRGRSLPLFLILLSSVFLNPIALASAIRSFILSIRTKQNIKICLGMPLVSFLHTLIMYWKASCDYLKLTYLDIAAEIIGFKTKQVPK